MFVFTVQQCAEADLSMQFPSVLVFVCCEWCLAGSDVDDGVQKKGGADSLYHHWLPWNQGGCDFCGYGDYLQTPYIHFVCLFFWMMNVYMYLCFRFRCLVSGHRNWNAYSHSFFYVSLKHWVRASEDSGNQSRLKRHVSSVRIKSCVVWVWFMHISKAWLTLSSSLNP